MTRTQNRRDFIKSAALLPLYAVAAAGLRSVATAQEPIKRVGGPQLKTSLNAYSFNKALNDHLKDPQSGMSLFDLLDFCARHNFDAIDATGYYFPGYPQAPSDTYINDFKRRAFQLGLDISGTGVRNSFTTPDKDKRAADVQHVKEWIEVAARMGAPVIRVFAGKEQEGYAREQVTEWVVEDLQACVAHGKRYGVIVAVQNHGAFLKTADQTIEIVRRVDSEWFGVVLDIGSFKTADPYDDIARVLPYAVNWQVKEYLFGKDTPVRTDLDKLVGIIRKGGYRGYLPIETLAVSGRPYDPEVLVPQLLHELEAALAQAS